MRAASGVRVLLRDDRWRRRARRPVPRGCPAGRRPAAPPAGASATLFLRRRPHRRRLQFSSRSNWTKSKLATEYAAWRWWLRMTFIMWLRLIHNDFNSCHLSTCFSFVVLAINFEVELLTSQLSTVVLGVGSKACRLWGYPYKPKSITSHDVKTISKSNHAHVELDIGDFANTSLAPQLLKREAYGAHQSVSISVFLTFFFFMLLKFLNTPPKYSWPVIARSLFIFTHILYEYP